MRLLEEIVNIYSDNPPQVPSNVYAFPELDVNQMDSAKRNPQTGVGNPAMKSNNDFPRLTIGKDGIVVPIFVNCHLKEEVDRVNIQLVAMFFTDINDDDSDSSALRFESPSAWMHGDDDLKGEHDFYHVQFCESLRAGSIEHQLPRGMANSWPTMPLQAHSGAELLWIFLYTVLGKKEAISRLRKSRLPFPEKQSYLELVSIA